MKQMGKVRIGVIGTGSISDSHLSSYAQNEDVEIWAVCDLNEARAQAKANTYNVKYIYTDYKELLANPEIDAVSICTWNNTHAEISIAALEAGKHVLCEKPLAKTVAEAKEIENAVNETSRVFQVGFVRRYTNNINLLKQFIDRDELGEIYYAKASCLRRLGNPGGWFSDKERSGGGPLIDLGVHIIDLCWYLMGRPKVKSISGNTYHKLGNRSNIKNLSYYKAADFNPDNNNVEDLANALIRFDNGASLLVDVSFTLHAKEDEISIKLYGENGGAEIEPELHIVSEKHNTILNMTPQIDNLSFDFNQAFQNEINSFIQSIKHGDTIVSPVTDGVEMMKILCGIYESSESGKEIYF